MCGLSLCCGTIANLSRDEIQQVVNFYRTQDGRVRYKEFCHMMENGKSISSLYIYSLVKIWKRFHCVFFGISLLSALEMIFCEEIVLNGFCIAFSAFTEPELEKKPTTQTLRPPVGALMKVLYRKSGY